MNAGRGEDFVYRFNGSMTEDEILNLYMILNSRGAATLPWVVAAEQGRADDWRRSFANAGLLSRSCNGRVELGNRLQAGLGRL